MTGGIDSSGHEPRDNEQEGAQADQGSRGAPDLVGQHIPLVSYPATTEELIATATAIGVPPKLMESLRRLEPGATFANAHEVWSALD